jgi:hypothetical protein
MVKELYGKELLQHKHRRYLDSAIKKISICYSLQQFIEFIQMLTAIANNKNSNFSEVIYNLVYEKYNCMEKKDQ